MDAAQVEPAGGAAGFFVRRWRREVSLGTLFWRDMMVVGSLINLATAFASLMALGFKAGALAASLVFLSPLPYNIFLAAAVWRTADLADARTAAFYRFAAAAWLVLATVI